MRNRITPELLQRAANTAWDKYGLTLPLSQFGYATLDEMETERLHAMKQLPGSAGVVARLAERCGRLSDLFDAMNKVRDDRRAEAARL